MFPELLAEFGYGHLSVGCHYSRMCLAGFRNEKSVVGHEQALTRVVRVDVPHPRGLHERTCQIIGRGLSGNSSGSSFSAFEGW